MSDLTSTAPRPRFLTNRRLTLLFLVTLVVVVIAFFVADNFIIVNVRILTWQLQARLAWVMLGCLALGSVLGGVLTLLWMRGRR